MSTRWLSAILVAAVLAVYANALSGPFVLDDQASVVENLQIRDFSLGQVLRPPIDSPVAARPLVNLSFAINYAIGGLDPRGYHVVNLALHIACALLAFAVARRALDVRLAFAAALLWAVHPLNSEVVNYVSQRTESMMAALYLLTLYAAIRARDAKRPAKWTAVAIAACAVGALCKESMATAPIAVALYDRIFLFDSWRAALARRTSLYAGLAATWVIVAVTIASGGRAAVAGFSSGVSPWTYLLNQTAMITEYLRLSAWPDRLVAFYGWPLPLTLADVAPYAVFIAFLGAATIVALVRAPRLGFLGAWVFITLAPASSIVPVATEVGAERRMYLPLVAVMVLLVLAASTILRRRAAAQAILLVVAASALGATTLERNREYQSGVTLARTIVERRPTGAAHHMLAEQLLAGKQAEAAIPHFREAVARGNSRAAYTLGIVLFNEGQYPEAIDRLEAFIATSGLPSPLVPRWLEPAPPEIVISRVAIGRSRLAQQQWRAASEQARMALAIAPASAEAHLLMGDAAFGEQQWDLAATHYREYLGRRPDDPRILLNYGITQVAAERLDEAVTAFARAVERDPANARARELLALAQEDLGRSAGQ